MGGGFGGGYPQQSSGPGLIKTAVVAGAAGLGGAALYNGEFLIVAQKHFY